MYMELTGSTLFSLLMQCMFNVKIAYKITERRAGDVATCYADPTLAEKELGWKTERSLDEMCKSL